MPQSALQVTLAELQTLAQQRFLQALQSRVKQHLTERLDAPPPDLAPSPGVAALLGLLKEVLSVAGVAEDKPQDIAKVNRAFHDLLLST